MGRIMDTGQRAHPFMPGDTAATRAQLLAALGLDSIDPLFAQIPAAHRAAALPDLPPALTSELELARHLEETLGRNHVYPAGRLFLGGGIWRHHVPAVVDEIVGRAEFLSPVWGTPSSDFGRNQAWFEFTSQLGALLEMELVGLPVYSWGAALGHAARMAMRLTGRRRLLVPALMCPERRAVLEGYAASTDPAARLVIEPLPCDAAGRIDRAAAAAALGPDVAALYYENPAWAGGLQTGARALADLARAAGALVIAGVDPSSLGVIAPPGALGADIAVGSLQPLGIHCHAGGGLGGFIASHDDPRFAAEYPTLLNSLTRTVDGAMAFALMRFHQSSYGSREDGKDWTGNSTYLWAVGAAAYMALLGPAGFAELGRLILARTALLADTLAAVPGVHVAERRGLFKEVVADLGPRRAEDVNAALRAAGLSGGLAVGDTRLMFAVTECHAEADIAHLGAALAEVLQ